MPGTGLALTCSNILFSHSMAGWRSLHSLDCVRYRSARAPLRDPS
jgi:hypothetical protein